MKIEKAHDVGRNLNVQELICVSMQRQPGSTRSTTTKREILKTLFLAMERLPDKNPAKHSLAFYWYKDGPYSEVIESNLQMLVADRKVTEQDRPVGDVQAGTRTRVEADRHV